MLLRTTKDNGNGQGNDHEYGAVNDTGDDGDVAPPEDNASSNGCCPCLVFNTF